MSGQWNKMMRGFDVLLVIGCCTDPDFEEVADGVHCLDQAKVSGLLCPEEGLCVGLGQDTW